MMRARTYLVAATLALAVGFLAGIACSSGGGVSCGAGLTDCGGVCVDLATDRLHCGACSSPTSVCAQGATCSAGACHCPEGEVACGSGAVKTCTDLQTSAQHCGACDHDCGLGSCSGGACGCEASPVKDCGSSSNPQCIDVSSDPANCGDCGKACPNKGAECKESTCGCPSSRPDVCAATCVDKQSDPQHCGDACVACPATYGCTGGACACPSGTHECSQLGGKVCADFETDRNHCGNCATACSASQVCVGGSCVSACPSGQQQCGDACYDLKKDPEHCGTCTTKCDAGLGCNNGSCALVCGGVACPTGSGTTCCAGDACPQEHANGMGQSYLDCAAQGQPTNSATYSPSMAQKAAQAWAPGGSEAATCGGCVGRRSADGNTCASWCFNGFAAGYGKVVNGSGLNCTCPLGPADASFSWN